jgi:3-deoxy-manno-octulosonate cytidylyltransferase (CMP-KDO synthetase)
MSMIEHVYRRVSLCDFLDDIFIATCDREIAEEVERFGGKFFMTSDRHESCVDRVAEAAQKLNAEIIVNVQGDMPLIHPDAIKKLIAPFFEEERLMFTDMMGVIEDDSEMNSPNVVKVVVDLECNALYYSREPIPSSQKLSVGYPLRKYKQFGINAFRWEALVTFTEMSRTPLEKVESVDMLRLLENGYKVRMVDSPYPAVGVDTIEDIVQVERLMQQDQILLNYLKR